MVKPWKEREENDLLQRYYAGAPLHIIAEDLGRTRKAIKSRLGVLLERKGLGRRTDNVSKQRYDATQAREKITKMWVQEGLPVTAIATTLGLGYGPLRECMKEWGLIMPEVRDRSDLDNLERMKLSDLPSSWSEVDEKTVITVAKVPRFVLVPIDQITEVTTK